MKALKIIFYSFFSLLVIFLVVGIIIVGNINKGAMPVYEGELQLAGIEAPVEVFRDDRGIPHIYAETEADLYIAVGYIMAQERLWQMDLIRRATTGELSEIFGEDYVQTDLFLRSLRMTQKSKMVLENTDEETLGYLENFMAGVNHYIENAEKLPAEFRILGYSPEAWTAENTANIIGYMGWDLAGGNLSGDVFFYKLIKQIGIEAAKELIPYYSWTGEPVYPDYELDENAIEDVLNFAEAVDKVKELGISAFHGSNNWAVSGERSETGKPLFSNDMHLGLSSPGIWMQMHQVVPGKLNVTGVMVPGQPFIIAGHNDSIAWGMTNLAVDDIDLYLENTNDEKTKYLLDGEWKDIIVEKEVIRVKKQDDRELELRYTHRGPVISGFRDIEDASISMRWSGNDISNELVAVCLLNRAASWEEFNEALENFNSISQNFIYADICGNIGLHSGGGVAIREGHGVLVRPGDSSKYDWKGYIPHDMLPFSYNPDNGSVSSANNKTVFPDDYPYYIGTYFSMPYRINRIREMLNEQDIFSVYDFKRMITDRHSDYAKTLTELLLQTLQKISEMNDLETEVYDNLSVWDYDMSPDSFVPTFFEYYRRNFADTLLKDDMGEIYDEFLGSARDYYLLMIIQGVHELYIDDVNTEETEDLEDMLIAAYHRTVQELENIYGPDTEDWLWGDIHRLTIMHPMSGVGLINSMFGLSEGPYRVGGSYHTVSPYSYGRDFLVDHGASQRHVYNLADWDESFTVIPTGVSGIPSSEFYLNQTETYSDDGFYKDHFSREAVEEAALYRLVLNPADGK